MIKKNNIYTYYLFYGIKSLIFYIPILVIYLNDVLDNSMQVGIVLAVKSISVFVLEVPLGYIADRFGRKLSIKFSIYANIISLILLITYPNFYTIIIAEIFFSISETLFSGADISMFYDNFVYENEEKLYDKFQRNVSLISSIALSIAFFVGSLVYPYNKYLVFIFSIIAMFALLFILRYIVEHPYKETQTKYKFNQVKKDLAKINTETILLKNLVVQGAITTSVFMGIYFYIFPLELNEISDNKLIYGLFYCIAVLLIGLGGKSQKYIKNNYKFTFNGVVAIIPLLIMVAFFQSRIFMIVFILFMRYFWGIYSTNLNILINKNISNSSLRATVFSLKNAILNIFLSCFFVITGYLQNEGYDSFTLLKYYAFLLFILVIGNHISKKQKIILTESYSKEM